MVIKATIIKVLFADMYVNVVFVIRCLYRAVSLTLVKEQRFIRIIIIIKSRTWCGASGAVWHGQSSVSVSPSWHMMQQAAVSITAFSSVSVMSTCVSSLTVPCLSSLVHRFYIMLFSALEETHCYRV